jgi:hypothetical protein
MHRIIPSSGLRIESLEPDHLESVEAHMQPYARCVVVKPCATDGVLELRPRQQHIRSCPACSLLTRRMCICKRWVRLMGDDCTRATSHGSCRDLFRATTVSSRCISPRGVAQIPAACTTRSALSLCTTTCGGTGGSQPKCEPLTSYCYDTRYGPQGKLSKIAFKCSVSI